MTYPQPTPPPRDSPVGPHTAGHGAPASAPPPGCPAHAGGTAPGGTYDSTGHGTGREPMYGPDFAADPFATYGRLRTAGPIAPVELAPGVRATLVLGYEAALHVLRSPETFSKDPRRWRDLADGTVPPDSPIAPMMAYRPNALFTDGQEHLRLRQAIEDSLARVQPNALAHYVERSADRLIDTFAGNGRADLLRDYAKVLPLLVFNELFGCPPEYGDRLVEGMSGIFDSTSAEAAGRANDLLTATVLELITLKRRQPAADVTSWLVAHPAQLTDEELLHTLILLMGAGTEPEQNLIANSLRLLLSDDRFAGSLSGGSLPVDDALDEVLWIDPPMANYAVHFPIHDTMYEGRRLPAGDPLVISFSAANNDPSLSSRRRAGNRAHLAWSAGPHSCPAQSSARLIASVAIEKLLDRVPDLELAVPVEQLLWRPGPFHRALSALPVLFPPASHSRPFARNAEAGRAHSTVETALPPHQVSPPPQRHAQPLPQAAEQQAGRISAPAPDGPPAAARTGLFSSLRAWWRGE